MADLFAWADDVRAARKVTVEDLPKWSDQELLAAYNGATRPFGFEAISDPVTILAGLRAVAALTPKETPGETSRRSVDTHQDAWADTHEGYTSNRVYVIRCLWCEFRAEATLHRDAKSQYDDHVRRIDMAGRAFFAADHAVPVEAKEN